MFVLYDDGGSTWSEKIGKEVEKLGMDAGSCVFGKEDGKLVRVKDSVDMCSEGS